MPKPVDAIQHENYKGVDIRSHPCEAVRHNKKRWKIRVDITFPTGGLTATAPEYLDEVNVFSTLNEAHTAGFRWGRHIIEHWLLTGLIPGPRVSRRLAEAATQGNRNS
jgi:hypothetical protein